MRGVLVFPQMDRAGVSALLTRIGRPQGEDMWLVNTSGGEPAIYVGFGDARQELDGWQPWETTALIRALGRCPEWYVSCDVSGRVPGETELLPLVCALLEPGGVAVDDYSDHLWTAWEIADGTRVAGLAFFDYETAQRRCAIVEQALAAAGPEAGALLDALTELSGYTGLTVREFPRGPGFTTIYARRRAMLAARGVNVAGLDRLLTYVSSQPDGGAIITVARADEDLSAVGFVDPADQVLVGWAVVPR